MLAIPFNTPDTTENFNNTPEHYYFNINFRTMVSKYSNRLKVKFSHSGVEFIENDLSRFVYV